MRSLVTFDFHNTLVQCDAWFQVEIADLPRAVFPELSDHMLADMHDAYREIRAEVIASGIERSAESTVLDLRDQFRVPLNDHTVTDRLHACMATLVDHARPVNGAIETLSALAADGYRMGVISSAVYHRFLELTLSRLELAPYIAFVATSASVGRYKSDPRLYTEILSDHDASPANSIHIGDSARWDVGSAAAAGMRTVLYDPPVALPGARPWSGAVPDWTVPDLRDVIAIVRTHLDPD